MNWGSLAKGVVGAFGGPAGAIMGGASILGGLLGGKPKTQYTNPVPQDIQGLRNSTSSYLMNNMGDLKQTAAQAPMVNYQGTQNVGHQMYGPTAYSSYQPSQSAGMGQSGQFINALARGGAESGLQTQAIDPAIRQSLMSGGGTVGASRVAGIAPTQSVNDLGTGFASQFMQNYNPLFEQQRQQALAAAKEASGNLTGSGFANALGNATSQTLAQQQGRLADLAQFGIGQEMGRQQTMAGLENQRNLTDAQLAQQASMANASNRMQGAQAYGNLAQQATQSNNDALLRALGINQQGLGMALSGDIQNRDMFSRENMFNANNALNNSQFNAGQQNNANQWQAGMNQNLDIFNRQQNANEGQFGANFANQQNQFNVGQQNDVNNANAQRYASLLGGMSTAGVGVPQAYQQPTFGQSLSAGINNLLPSIINRGQGGSPAMPTVGNIGVQNPITSSVPSFNSNARLQMPSWPSGTFGANSYSYAPDVANPASAYGSITGQQGAMYGGFGGSNGRPWYLNALPSMAVNGG